MVDEYRAFVGPWGFTLDEIAVPTRVHQGTADTLVPPKWADELVAGIPTRRSRPTTAKAT